jgi:PAS domain S-box-containing protein
MPNALVPGMKTPAPTYQIDSKWRIIRANEAFCRIFRCTEFSLIGRDARDLLRDDWRLTFRTYVARALVGIGEYEATVPLVAPCGQEGWYRHTLEPLEDNGHLVGYRATIAPREVHAAEPRKRWWDFRAQSPRLVWDFDVEQLEPATEAAA